VIVEVSEMMRRGHISLPNGLGLDYESGDGVTVRVEIGRASCRERV